MKRRELLTLVGGAMAFPGLAARAQQKPMPVVGFLSFAAPNTKPAAFFEGLRQTGYVEGRNVRIEYRWADGDYARLPASAADLVARKVDVIVTDGGNPETRAAKNATSTIPIIFIGSDPIENNFVTSLARPGGNLTGIGSFQTEITAKRFDLLEQLVPSARTIGFLANPSRDDMGRIVREVGKVIRGKGLEFVVANAAAEPDLDAAFDTLRQHHVDAFFEAGDAFFGVNRERIVALAAEYRLPALYHLRAFVDAGGLSSYAPDFETIYRQEGMYAGRVLNGEKPANLPVIQPTKFDLVINLRTAKTLGLAVPQLLLARADEVIE
jgi:ABC-type uncharacterized transport system substrate-binding protein